MFTITGRSFRPCGRATRLGLLTLFCALGLWPGPAWAYPPALPHTFYGMIRDELGNPLPAGASITLESDAGVQVFGDVSGLLEPGVNYRLLVPLDAGLSGDAYRPTALNPRVPFKIKVKVGKTVYLPLEMSHDFAQMGEPGKMTLLNLTLGVDSNGDGIPDAWQRRVNPDINKVKPEGDADGDGMSNLQEYLAGTYAYDPKSGFRLTIVRSDGTTPVLGMTVITGRSYTVLGTTDLTTWNPVHFRVLAPTGATEPMERYSATDIRSIQVQVDTPTGQPVPRFFKAMVE